MDKPPPDPIRIENEQTAAESRDLSEPSLVGELNAIAMRCAKRPILSPLSADEILSYDEVGAPTR